jgi:hypothetical protein
VPCLLTAPSGQTDAPTTVRGHIRKIEEGQNNEGSDRSGLNSVGR